MRALLCALLLALAIPSTALSSTERDKKSARMHFQRAEKFFEVGRFKKALEHYRRAYELYRAPALLFNMGQCHRNLGDKEKALFFYKRYLGEYHDGPHRKDVEAIIAELEEELAARAPPPSADTSSVATLTVTAQPPPAPVLVTPARVQTEPTEETPAHETWWFWTLIGVGVAAAATGTALIVQSQRPEIPEASLETWDER